MRERAVMARIIGFHRGKSSDVVMVREAADKYTVAKGTEFKSKGRPTITHKVEATTYPEARSAFEELSANA
ncbi:hypothetical protein [Nonomuraea zeae]|uniref:hypothetical protein n=1 Tax=Nonomuraea zeae TaxID=1642303 RepID=UPI0036146A19